MTTSTIGESVVSWNLFIAIERLLLGPAMAARPQKEETLEERWARDSDFRTAGLTIEQAVALTGLDDDYLSDEVRCDLHEWLGRAAACSSADCLSLNTVTALRQETAASLARFKGLRLMLPRVTALTGSAAKALADFNGRIDLPGLRQLTREIASAFGNSRNTLFFPSIRTLSRTVVEALAGPELLEQLSMIDQSNVLHAVDNAHDKYALTDSGNLVHSQYAITSFGDPDDWQSNKDGQVGKKRTEVHFEGVTDIGPAVAEALRYTHTRLNFSGLTTLAQESVEILSECSAVVLPENLSS